MEKPSGNPERWPPATRYALAAIARNGGLYVVAVASVPLLVAVNAWLSLVAMAVIGLAMYRLTMVMHDCIHGTLFASHRVNRLAGVLAGAASGIEFNAFARLHRKHHRVFGEPDDPQGPDYFLPQPASRAAILWHLFRPLLGYNVFKLGQVFIAMQRDDDRMERIPLASFLILIATQLFTATVASGGFAMWWLAPLPLLSAATFGLFFAQTRGFAEHVAMPGVEPRGYVRSHRPALIDRVLLYDLHFNFHREHHLHPQVPSCWLPTLHEVLAAEDAQFRLDGSMLDTIYARLAAAKGNV
jgi:fatty acid desaturase